MPPGKPKGGRFFITILISVLVTSLFRFFNFSQFSPEMYKSKNVSISSKLSNVLASIKPEKKRTKLEVSHFLVSNYITKP